MISTFRRIARKYPSLTALIVGILLSVLPVGLGMNTKRLIENDLIPDRFWLQFQILLRVLSVLMAAMAFVGFLLIGLSALIAVRRFNKKSVESTSDDPKEQTLVP